jgi:hypothetical protein
MPSNSVGYLVDYLVFMCGERKNLVTSQNVMEILI